MSRSNAALAAPAVRDAAPLFAALGDPTRLKLIVRLAEGPSSIATLADKSTVSRQAIKKHLDVLGDAGLVSSDRRGRESIFQLEAKRVADAQRYLEQISAQWDDALLRLKKFVEE